MHDIKIDIGYDILQANEEIAAKNRRLFDEHGITSLNIMGAIGSGKTTLIELAIQKLAAKYRIGTIAGDVVASIDAERFQRHHVPTVALNTGKECHLDANLMEHAIEQLPLDNLDLLLIENVGNLICPTDFPLGEHFRVVVVSVSEGDDIVKKHPLIFLRCDLMIVNKVDIAEAVGADADKMVNDALMINPKVRTLKTSKTTGEGIDEWIKFIQEGLDAGQ